MAEQPPQAPVQRRRSAAVLIAGTALLVALVALGVVIYGVIWQSTHAGIEVHLPTASVAGTGIAIVVIVAIFCGMGIWDLLTAIFETIGAALALIGAILAAIVTGIFSLFG